MPHSALQFEDKLIRFCSPTLLKMKAGNIFNIEEDFDELEECLNYYNHLCNQKDIYLVSIAHHHHCHMIYVYQKNKLQNIFHNPKFRSLFLQYQYPLNDIDDFLNGLKQRLNGQNFPHEIGLFLGYPFLDVLSFIEGKPHKYIGYWKVYSHIPQSIQTFDKYKKCTQEMKRRFQNGKRIQELIQYI